MTTRRQFHLHSLATAGALLGLPLTGFAQASDFPSRPIRVIVPFAAGGGPDLLARKMAVKLGEVLGKLLDNALKFTPAGDAPRIRIEAHAQGERVLLSVSDQGIGFDMKYHDRIFGMFQRLHRQDQIPGTGIGLALVHKAVERMGGQIRAESAPGQGATFYLDLPRA